MSTFRNLRDLETFVTSARLGRMTSVDHRTLEETGFDQIHEAFTEAFSDYVVPLSPTRDQQLELLTRRGWTPELSVGAFLDGRLIGFALNALDGESAYNSGTGVVASHRRDHVASQIMRRSAVPAPHSSSRGRIRHNDMKKTKRFDPDVRAAIRKDKILGVRAGFGPHRIIGIWVVVVEGRVFVRSWSLKPRSWWRTFLEDPRGIINVNGREIAVRAVRTRSERLKDEVSRAYLEKYGTPGSVRYARDLGRAKSRDTTTELVPL